MKDIDFDELDKAVNSLMATTPAESAAPVPVATTSPAQTVAVAPVVAPAPAPTPIQVAQPIPVAVRSVPPAIRRTGRFMDMVPASADKKQRDATSPKPTSSREGLAISPRTDGIDSLATGPVPAVQATAASAPVTMPDPIDMVQNPPVEPEPQEPISVNQTADVSTQPPAPIESPFLTDTKVEKRPLNAGTSEPSGPTIDMRGLLDADMPGSYEAGSNNDSINDHVDEPPVTPQIPELSSDLVAIESSSGTDVIQATETSDAASQVEVPSTPLGAASIAQQYQTQASTGDQSHAAIYDASQYPEPVAHPAKHTSGWLWVLWVILLLGVGAGGAFLLYNFGIIP